jgi:hypothetical protein
MNDIDACIDMLAATKISGRAKRANSFTDQLGSYATNAMSALSNAASGVKSTIGDDAYKHLGYGLAGAGLGAGAGALSQYMAPEKNRRPLSAMLAGGLLGGTLGASGSLLHSSLNKNIGPGGGGGETQAQINERLRTAQEAMDRIGQQGTYSDRLNQIARGYRMSPEHMQRLHRYANQDGRDIGHSAFLADAARDQGPAGMFTLPARSTETGQVPHQLAEALSQGGLEQNIGGFDPRELRRLTTPEARQQFIERTVNNNTSQGIFSRGIRPRAEGSPTHTRESLGAQLESLIQQANNPTRNYRWQRAVNTQGDTATQSLLNELGGHVSSTSMGGHAGRVGNDVYHRLNQAMQRGRENPAEGLRHLGNVPGVIPGLNNENQGLGPELARMLTPSTNSMNTNSPAFAALTSASMDPTELRDIHVNPSTKDDFINRVIRQGRLSSPNGQPWTAETLNAQLPDLIQKALQVSQPDSAFHNYIRQPALNMLNSASPTGGTYSDIAALTTAGDVGGTLVQSLRNHVTGYNPHDLQRAIRAAATNGGTIGSLDEQAVKYLQHVESTHGLPGLRQLSRNPQAFVQGNPMPAGLLNRAANSMASAWQGGVPSTNPGFISRMLNRAVAATSPSGTNTFSAGGTDLHGADLEPLIANARSPLNRASGPATMAASEIPSVARNISNTIRHGGAQNVPGLEMLKQLPPQEAEGILQHLLANRNARHTFRNGITLAAEDLAPIAQQGRALSGGGLSGIIHRPYAGGLFGNVPRWAGHLAPHVAASLLLNMGQPAADRVEQLHARQMNNPAAR